MNTSNRTLDALLVIAAEDLINDDLEFARSLDTSNTCIPEKTLRRIRRKIKKLERRSVWESLPLTCRRAVAAVLILCTTAFGVCMGIEPIRAVIVDTVIEWYEKFVSVFYIPASTPPTTIEEYREPQLQIAGTERVVMMQTKNSNYIIYTRESSKLIDYQQILINSTPTDLDNDDFTVTEIPVNKYIGQLFSYTNGKQTITWHDNQYRYAISSFSPDISSETLLSIAESIK